MNVASGVVFDFSQLLFATLLWRKLSRKIAHFVVLLALRYLLANLALNRRRVCHSLLRQHAHHV